MLVIPSMDLRDGRCVRLYQGNFAWETRYSNSPIELLERYRNLGARWVHVVDLDAVRTASRINRALIASLARHPMMYLQVGGGVRAADDLHELFAAGAARVVIGSLAVEKAQYVAEWIKAFGTERICLAFDVRMDAKGEFYVHTHGWKRNSTLTLWAAVQPFADSAKHVVCTDIERDGSDRGPNLRLYRAALARFPGISWQASGGVRNGLDLCALRDLGVRAAISGRALIEGRMHYEELKSFLPDASSPVSTSATA